MILFANEPPAYRQAMFGALSQRGIHAVLLPARATIEDGVRGQAPSVIVISGPEDRARRLSALFPVINLTYEPAERATMFRAGAVEESRVLEGLADLSGLIGLWTHSSTR